MDCPLPAATIIDTMVRQALAEDVGSGDVTAQLLPANQRTTARVSSREAGVLCGSAWFERVFHQLDASIQINWSCRDGETIQPNQSLCELHGPTRALLSAERVALNFLQTLSGTATLTRQYVAALAGTHTRLLDTRKTIPLWRHAQKYAVCCGGGHNHRMGLYDMVLIKENHITSAGSVTAALARAQQLYPHLPIEIEVENLAELTEALQAGATRVLLDNMDIDTMTAAVRIASGRAQLEASGNVRLDTITQIAMTGVDFISVGSITKHVRALDLSMRIHLTPSQDS